MEVVNKQDPGEHRIIIGVSFGYHDASCCILKDGKLLAAVQEERFSRVKNDRSFPRQSLRYCLEVAGVSLAEVDCFAYYENPEKKLSRQLWMGAVDDADTIRKKQVIDHVYSLRPEQEIRTITGYAGRIEIVEHHLSHAASAYYYSGFSDAAILTVDGVGEWATTSYGAGGETSLNIFEEVDFPHSLGLFYSTVTAFLGFKVNSGEYKVMGLAPYGKPKYTKQVRKLIKVLDKGQYELNLEYFDFLNTHRMFSDKFTELFNIMPRVPESVLLQQHKDIAKSVQVVLEEILLEKVHYLYTQMPSKNLCMAGGVALNCVANGRISRDGPFENVFVQPAAGDAGTSLGAAAVAYVRITGKRPDPAPLNNVYLGPEYPASDILRLVKNSQVAFNDFTGNENALVEFVAEKINKGCIIGWYQGRMEFGPRALGARSIIADPRRPDMREKINGLVKKREGFRPFAPAVKLDKVQEHFQLAKASPFMLETCQVISPLHLPAITHVDNSARVQTVDESSNPRFYRLLDAFEQLTGCPILLNTSFNVRGEPVVCSPMDAITCFIRAEIDYLVLGDCVISQQDIPEVWHLGVSNTPLKKYHQARAIGHAVYSFL